MKKRLFLLVVGVLLVLPLTAYAAETPTLTINGYESTQKDANYINDTGVMMVSEEVLAKDMDMAVQREGKKLTVSTLRDTILLKGQVGDTTAQLVGQHTTLPTAIEEKNGKAYLPLRALISPFGEVEWRGFDKSTQVCYDFNAFEKVPDIQVSDTPLPYHEVINAGVGFDSKKQRFLGDNKDGALLFENLSNEEEIISVSDISGNNVLIEPVHEGYQLINSLVGESQVAWIEVRPHDKKGKGIDWYLYTKSLAGDSKPICIDQAPEKYKEEEYIFVRRLFHCVEMKGDYLAYPFYNQESGNMEVRLYNLSSKKIDVLDTLSVKETQIHTEYNALSGDIELSLSDTGIVWSKAVPTVSGRYYTDLYHYDIASKKKVALLQGCDLESPFLIHNTLIVTNRGFADTIEADDRELWLYNVQSNKWIARVTKQTPTVEGEIWLYRPLRDQYMTFDSVNSVPQAVPIVDVEKGILYRAKNPYGEMLTIRVPEKEHAVPNQIITSSAKNKMLYLVGQLSAENDEDQNSVQPFILGE